MCSVDAYLADPANVAYLTSITAPSSRRKGQRSTSTSAADPMELDDDCAPIEVNTRTSHHVPALNNLCQSRGLTPIYNISGEVDKALFTGSLKVGKVTITLDQECRSKKEVRELLAEQALEAVKTMDGPSREDQSADDEGQNWVGKLLGKSFMRLSLIPICLSLSLFFFLLFPTQSAPNHASPGLLLPSCPGKDPHGYHSIHPALKIAALTYRARTKMH